ncbi:hypothetical protein D9M70_372620 [compost metagenome]
MRLRLYLEIIRSVFFAAWWSVPGRDSFFILVYSSSNFFRVSGNLYCVPKKPARRRAARDQRKGFRAG